MTNGEFLREKVTFTNYNSIKKKKNAHYQSILQQSRKH